MIQVTKKRYQQPSNFEDNAIILGQDDIPIGDWDRNWTLNLSLFVNKHSTIYLNWSQELNYSHLGMVL